MRVRRAALAVGLLASVAACQLLAGIGDDHFTVAPAPVVEAGVDASDAMPPPVDPCVRRRPPPPPGPGNSDETGPFVVFVDDFDFSSTTDAGTPAGYDLDDVCTCFDGGATAHAAAPSCVTPSGNACDGVGGIDDGFGVLINQLQGLGASFDLVGKLVSAQREDIACGRRALTLVLRGYNGLANDDDVSIGPVLSAGIYESLPDASTPATVDPNCLFAGQDPDSGAFGRAPKHDGTDVWSAPPGALLPESTPTNPLPGRVLTGYVTNYQLVVSYEDDRHSLPFNLGGNEITFGTPLVVARLVPVNAANQPIELGNDGKPSTKPSAFKMVDGVLGGRVTASLFIAAAGGLSTSRDADGGNVRFCNDGLLFPQLRSFVCRSADIQQLQRNDFAPGTCDSLSVMIQFSANPAHLYGTHRADAPGTASCPADFSRCTP
jgi:hypothetical protein